MQQGHRRAELHRVDRPEDRLGRSARRCRGRARSTHAGAAQGRRAPGRPAPRPASRWRTSSRRAVPQAKRAGERRTTSSGSPCDLAAVQRGRRVDRVLRVDEPGQIECSIRRFVVARTDPCPVAFHPVGAAPTPSQLVLVSKSRTLPSASMRTGDISGAGRDDHRAPVSEGRVVRHADLQVHIDRVGVGETAEARLDGLDDSRS